MLIYVRKWNIFCYALIRETSYLSPRQAKPEFDLANRHIRQPKHVQYTVQCTVYSVHCTLYTVQCTLYIVQNEGLLTLSREAALFCTVVRWNDDPILCSKFKYSTVDGTWDCVFFLNFWGDFIILVSRNCLIRRFLKWKQVLLFFWAHACVKFWKNHYQ